MAHAGSASIVKVHDNRYVRAYARVGYPNVMFNAGMQCNIGGFRGPAIQV